MRLFVTGSSGFIGSHLLGQAVDAGFPVAVLLRPGGDRRRIAPLLPRVTVIEGSLDKPEDWVGRLAIFAPQTVIHLAWTGVGNRARNDPGQTRNVHETAELVKWAAGAGARSWIGLGSQAEYGPGNRRIDENEPTCPTTLYGVSKLAACLVARGLCAQMGIRFAWLRLFSAYGPRDDASWMIPSVILQLNAGKRPALTRCEQRWDFVYVADVADAILRTALTAEAEGIFNLGSGEARPLREIVETIRDLVSPGAPLGFGEIPYRPDQVMHLEANIDRLQRLTNWTPRTSLMEGLRQTVAFYSDQPSVAKTVNIP